MEIEHALKFNVNITIEKDVTAYGNRYWIQVNDTEEEDNSFLEQILDKDGNATIYFVPDGGTNDESRN